MTTSPLQPSSPIPHSYVTQPPAKQTSSSLNALVKKTLAPSSGKPISLLGRVTPSTINNDKPVAIFQNHIKTPSK